MNIEELRKLYSELNKLRVQHNSWAREDIDRVIKIVKNDIEYTEKLLKTAQNLKEFVKNAEKDEENRKNPILRAIKTADSLKLIESR